MPHQTLVHRVLVALQVATLLCLPVVVRAQDGFPAGGQPEPAPAPRAQDFPPEAFAPEGRPLGVRISSQGVLAGRFSVADAITGKKVPARQLVISVVKDGKVVSRAKPGVGGVFQVKGLRAGAYSIVADGPDGYFSSKIRVLPPLAGAGSAADQALQIDATVVHPINANLAKTIIRDRFLPVDQALSRSMSATFRGEPRDAVSAPLETPMLYLAKNGGLKVRLVGLTPGRSNEAREVISDGYLLQRGKVAARATSDPTGVMDFAPVSPGTYSLVVLNSVNKGAVIAAGSWSNQPRAGFVAMGVQVIGLPPAPRGGEPVPTPASASYSLEDEQQFVQAEGSDVNEIEGVDSTEGEAAVIDTTEPPPPEVVQPGGGGFVGGGGGGTGGGGGGGGGLGLGLGLAALAGIGAAAAIAANDDNNGFAAPASPATPAPNVIP